MFRVAMQKIACALLMGSSISCAGGKEPGYEDVEAIFSSKCARCHSEPLDQFQAPFALTTYDEIFARNEEIERAIRTGTMPLMANGLNPPVEELSEEEKVTILNWLSAGASE